MIVRHVSRRFSGGLAVLALVMAIGTLGYGVIGGPSTTVLDAAYMTFITIATIGYGEIVDLQHSPGGRVFTMLIATAGIATVTYLMSATTAFILEGEFNAALRRRKMLNRIAALEGHYIVCGIGRVGSNVTRELHVTGRRYVVIETDREKIDGYLERHPDTLFVHHDAAEDDALRAAGIDRCAGVFAVTGEDAKNLVITLSAKAIKPGVRVVARCHEVNYIEKIRRVGADEIVSPDFTGGMRIASSMVRPHVVTFLDQMMREQHHIRLEEVKVPRRAAGLTLIELGLRSREFLVVAVQGAGGLEFNPSEERRFAEGETILILATPDGRRALEAKLV